MNPITSNQIATSASQMKNISSTCYLCGEFLTEPISNDHVPMRQLYAREIRKKHNPNLLTIPVHKACNHSYQYDEDYFVYSLMPSAYKSYSGNAVEQEILRKYRRDEKEGLVRRMMGEFDLYSRGLVLPNNKIVKRFDGVRIHRVVWKIVRGLYCYNYKEVLPEQTPNGWEITSPGETPPIEFFALSDEPTRGQYPGVFDYKFVKFPEAEVHNINLCAILLWDCLILIIWFHDPSCNCNQCLSLGRERTIRIMKEENVST